MKQLRKKYLFAAGAIALLVSACGAPAPTAAPAAEKPAEAPKPTEAPKAEAPKPTEAPAAAPAEKVTISYTLWDSNQQPAYEACAAEFSKKNPNIAVKIEQKGWDDYWSALQTGFVGGTASDVFTNHLAKYPEFASKGVLLDIEPLVKRDKVDTGIYLGELANLWGREGKRYGLPKDWDTIAVVYNGDVLKKAGVDAAALKGLDWNAKDGGSFGKLIAKLTTDKAGKRGDEAGFDKKNVDVYGYAPPGSGGFGGQTEWSHFAVSNGFKFTDGPWTKKYYYDDPKLAETIQWVADQNLVNGFSPPLADVRSLGLNTLFKNGKVAATTVGSWQIGEYTKDVKFPVLFGLLPKGPAGRKSMFNGLADSIWVGTKHPDQAWEWVKFAASPECENIVGSKGVVFPAVKSGVDNALKVYTERGLDVTAFTDLATDPNATFLFPITDNGAEIASIMGPIMDSIFLGEKKADVALKEANDKVNALFK
jgi:multiple sugar transport system substrate-binding protein